VARVFPGPRPAAAAEADAELPRFVSGWDFPAERCAALGGLLGELHTLPGGPGRIRRITREKLGTCAIARAH
jgi:hypothetical protein